MKKYLILIIAVLGILFTLLTACGNENNKDSNFTEEIENNIETKSIEKPDFCTEFIYNGMEQFLNIPANDYYSISGDISGKNAGKYSAIISLEYKLNSHWSDNTSDDIFIDWEIKRATFDTSALNFRDRTVTADGNMHSITIDTALPDGITMEVTGDKYDLPGTYTYTASFKHDDNYNDIEDISATLTILPKEIDLSSFVYNFDFTYSLDDNYNPVIHTATIDNLPDGVTAKLENNIHSTAGEYEVTITFYNNDKYSLPIPQITKIMTIAKANFDIPITFSDRTVTYNGEAHSIEATLPNKNPITLINSITISYNECDKINAGTYIIKATITNSENSSFNEFTQELSATLTIEKLMIDKPQVNTEVEFEGTETGPDIPQSQYYTIGGEYSAKVPSENGYIATITLNDPSNTCWSDGTSEPMEIHWNIVGMPSRALSLPSLVKGSSIPQQIA